MHWIEKVMGDLEQRGDEIVVLSTGKTPSGYIHIGISRELTYCSAFERGLKERGMKTKFLLFIDSMDPVKKFPPYVPESFTPHTGKPMFDVPCPEEDCCGSYAEHFGNLLIRNLEPFGLRPEIIWSHKLYKTREMQDLIRTTLRNITTIREIFINVVGPTLAPSQFEQYRERVRAQIPCQVICVHCGKMTEATSFDLEGDTISYACKWCGGEGHVPIKGGGVKLTWRVDWPAKWALYKVSCEPAGKDHCVKGGAYDTGEEICRKVFGWKGPYRVPFEWFLLGGKAMKTHKGISFTWDEWLAVAPPETLRYLVLRQSPRKHISFHPERVPQLMDEFERFESIYYGKEEVDDENREMVRLIYPLCMPLDVTEKPPVRIPYRFAVIFSQIEPLIGRPKVLKKAISTIKKMYGLEKVTKHHLEEIRKTLKRGEYWVRYYAPSSMRIEVPKRVGPEILQRISEKQKLALRIFADKFEAADWDEQSLQNAIFEIAKGIGLKAAQVFQALYLILLAKEYGPRMAPFLLSLDKAFVLRRLEEAYK